MASEKLTALKVRQARTPGLLNDGKGLSLRVGDGGTKSWVFRFMLAGRAREMGLGSLADVTLAEARERARDARRLLKDGQDPIEARRVQNAARAVEAARVMTFQQCAEAYIAAHKEGWTNPKHAKQWPTTLATYVYPTIGKLPVASIDVALVMKVLEPIWTTRPETASRIRGRIASVLDWATARGYRQGDSPAQWKGRLEYLLPKTSKLVRGEHHLAALPYSDIGAFMAELRQQQCVAARALEFTILTAARSGEVIGARWEEFDEPGLWVVSAERMKTGAEHRVPLAGRAIEILKEMRVIRQGDLVFPGARGGRSMSHSAMLRVLQAMQREDLTAHGFRSSFRDWAAERTNFPREVCEMALAHAIENKVEAAYRRGDLFAKRRQLMDAWGRFCASSAAIGGKAVALAAAV